jgi:hypothetical protein
VGNLDTNLGVTFCIFHNDKCEFFLENRICWKFVLGDDDRKVNQIKDQVFFYYSKYFQDLSFFMWLTWRFCWRFIIGKASYVTKATWYKKKNKEDWLRWLEGSVITNIWYTVQCLRKFTSYFPEEAESGLCQNPNHAKQILPPSLYHLESVFIRKTRFPKDKYLGTESTAQSNALQ